MEKNNKIIRILSYVLTALAGAAIAVAVTVSIMLPGSVPTKLESLENLILKCFIGDKDQTTMEDAAAHAMIASLGDRWSYYIPAKEVAAYEERMSNAYVGIGVTISARPDNGGLTILNVTPEGPADQAGLKANDVIVAVEGERFTSENMNEVQDKIRGEEGTEVQITVLRDAEEKTFSVKRMHINTPVAKGQMLENGVGLIKIVNFNNNCAKETIELIEKLKEQGAQKLIFDVRFNPGGYASELVKVLDYLLPEGELFRTVDYNGNENVDKSDASFLDMPMAVLVNDSSYSAAEFFAAALQEYEAGTVVGQKTCGKGYFQNTFYLPDGSAVGISVGKYFTPKGVSLAGVGITPEISVEVSEDVAAQIYSEQLEPMQDPQVLAALEALK